MSVNAAREHLSISKVSCTQTLPLSTSETASDGNVHITNHKAENKKIVVAMIRKID